MTGGKVAFVTGGSRGIGQAIARALTRAGTRVAITATSDSTLETAVRELASGVALEGDPSASKESAHCFKWDGRDSRGEPVPPGPYRLYLELGDIDRQVVSGEKLKLTPENAP